MLTTDMDGLYSVGIGPGSVGGVLMSGVLTGITSTGNLTLTWAQNSSSGTPTVLLAGSYLELQRIV